MDDVEKVKDQLRSYLNLLSNAKGGYQRKYNAYKIVIFISLVMFFFLYFQDGFSDQSLKAYNSLLDFFLWSFGVFCSGNAAEYLFKRGRK